MGNRISKAAHLAKRARYTIDNLAALGRDTCQKYGFRRLLLRGPLYLYANYVRPRFLAWYHRLFVGGSFEFNGNELDYFFHPSNRTWTNGRQIEIPIGRSFSEEYPPEDVLEIGNVLNHYFPVSHDVLDKYEEYPGVINEDIVEFSPDRSYDLVFAISTIEHIGYDEEPKEPRKVVRAVEHIGGLLSDEGTFIATWPLGKNQYLDEWHRDGTIPFTDRYYMKRTGNCRWRQATWEEVKDSTYEYPDPSVEAISVAVLDSSND